MRAVRDLIMAQLGRGPADLRQLRAAMVTYGHTISPVDILEQMAVLVETKYAERVEGARCWRLTEKLGKAAK